MQSHILLDSLKVHGFRILRQLEIKRLGRVNLIVGKNNVGKSTLLEALWLYANRNHAAVWELLELRDEGQYHTEEDSENVDSRLNALGYLFHGQDRSLTKNAQIVVGELYSQTKEVTLSFRWEVAEYDEFMGPSASEVKPKLTIQTGDGRRADDRLDEEPIPASNIESIRNVFLPARGLDANKIERLWSEIALTKNEEQVVEALRIVDPQIDRVGLVSNPTIGMKHIPIVKLAGVENTIPLRSLGDGINRMFYVALTLVNAQNGLLLIDEIGSGMHYSVQFDLWRMIFSVASRLNVQVFATTHSNDCIYAFQQAACENDREEGMLIRLENRKGEIVPILFDEERLSIATRQDIEVR